MTSLAVAAAAVAVVGAVVGTVASVQASRQQAALQKSVKRQKEQEAITAEETAEFNERQHRRRMAILLGSQRAGYAAAGYDPGTGTPLEREIDLISQGELEALAIKREGAIAGGERRFEAGVAQFQRRAAIRAIPLQVAGGVLGAASSGMQAYSYSTTKKTPRASYGSDWTG